MFVHPKNEPAKPDNKPDKPGKGGGGKKGGGGPDCFAFIAKGAKWENTEGYVLNTSNGDELDETSGGFVDNTISTSLGTWNTGADFTIFESGILTTELLVVDTSSPDGSNEVLFGDIDEPNVIASTIVWRTIGPPHLRQLVEWDMIFNDRDFQWGNARTMTSETVLGDITIMDLENIATHEAGHAAGMAHPDNSCTDETMYAFAELGETKKRTLEAGDIDGINQFY